MELTVAGIDVLDDCAQGAFHQYRHSTAVGLTRGARGDRIAPLRLRLTRASVLDLPSLRLYRGCCLPDRVGREFGLLQYGDVRLPARDDLRSRP